MDLIKERIPGKRESLLLFVVCMLPVHIWAYVVFFYEVPGYILRMDIWELLRVLAYIQLVALGESVVFWVGILFINITLPTRFFRKKFLPSGIVVMLMIFIWIIPLHYQPLIFEKLEDNTGLYQILMLLWVLLIFGIMFGALRLIHRNQRFADCLSAIPERLTLLAIIFLVLDLFGFLLLVFRYLG